MRRVWALLVLCAWVLIGCGSSGGSKFSGVEFTILSGSENKSIEPLVKRFAEERGASVKFEYLGSVDIMMRLQAGRLSQDAVWPASRIWLSLGDRQKQVRDDTGIYWSPVVMAVKRPVAQRLGWIGKDVRVADMVAAAREGRFRFMMTSATQSNSGASAYLGFLSALAGEADALQADDLQRPAVQKGVRELLAAVNRSSGSSGWLKDLFLQRYDAYDAMVNYESVVIETNRELESQGREPLVAITPVDGTAIADSPLGFIDQGDESKRRFFDELKAFLLSEPTQRELRLSGRRTGPIGEPIADAGDAFRSDWGIDTTKFLNQIKVPEPRVIEDALVLYQTALRKPSYTVFVLDFSGSMRGDREESLKEAMRLVLDQETARRNLLQATPRDTTLIVTFADQVSSIRRVDGNNPERMRRLIAEIAEESPSGGTAMYDAVLAGLREMKKDPRAQGAFPAVILLSDGRSNRGLGARDFAQRMQSADVLGDVPVFSIQFGDADMAQLEELARISSGRVFDGKADLVKAFREAKGYN